MPLLLGRYSLWEGSCKEMYFWFIPSFCWVFALPGMGFYTEHIICSWMVIKGHFCLVTQTSFAYGVFSLSSKPGCLSFLSSGFLWCPSQELPAGQLCNGNALVPGKALLCDMAAETRRIPHCDQHSKQFRLNIRKIVLPRTHKMCKCCGTSTERCLNPCYIEKAD